MDRVFRSRASTARRSSASRSTRRARRAPPTGSCGSRKRIYDIAIERYGLEPTDLIFDALDVPALDRRRRPPPRRDGDHRGDPPHQGELPGRVDDPRPVERVVRAQARGPPRAQQRVPARVPRGGARRRDRARGAHHADATRSTSASARSRSTHLRPARARATTRSPSSWRCSKASSAARSRSEDRSGWPVEERLKHRIIDGDRDGLEADLDEAAGDAPRARDHQRRAARRDEGRRRAVRLRARCSCRSCCSRPRR